MPKANMKPVATKTKTKAPSPKISEIEKTPPEPVDETGGGIFNSEGEDIKDEGGEKTPEAPQTQEEAGTDPEPEEAPKDPDEEPGPTEEELARYEAAKAEEEEKAATEATAIKRVKAAKQKRQATLDKYKKSYKKNKEKGLLVYSMKKGARFGELCVDGDVIITIKSDAFKRKSEFLEVVAKLELAVKEDRSNER